MLKNDLPQASGGLFLLKNDFLLVSGGLRRVADDLLDSSGGLRPVAENRACPFAYRKETINKPSATATIVATKPGIMNEWFRMYLPMRVVPVRSKLMAATTVG